MEGAAVMDKNRLKAYFGNQPLEFEASDITLVYRGAGVQEESSYPDRIELTRGIDGHVLQGSRCG